ncbi:MAG: UDP-N-acetylglucosamine--N-acetylmuramyl-(pentapeptide) pyrophosphoryl-undecaprenol N-acetylglucosamine transferase [Candidatus Sungbacteria bacterium]|uniref:UDP-N-acetylglucosamine--N-acetylmuramyl-(pentapeptide) pyrophosphoryl-undecaprenol N-acetylglucosamine transferase n=1 Tax=Candidatus Sungiibacteriota bacterium TaxID=2750080 RepID=A0A932QZ54_9BACT|nr:UDP-N-acetylglucosamine--N-acetylmuramyl-(pentapeptide) pyrophosphoryl-undecaprenol N-acetylglucosamine transferase [Candidatus Sungbacteria bacterium]
MRILFTGGGGGGHFFPVLAVIRELKRVAEEEQILDVQLFYIGPDDFGQDLLREEGVAPVRITSGKMRRYASVRNIADIFKTFLGVVQAFWNIFLIMPDVIFSKGSYGALPAVVVSAVFRIPLMIHESDAIPGRVSRFSARFASRIGVAFPSAAAYFPKAKVALVGIPLRRRILGGIKEEAAETFNVFSDLPVIGVIGASQGAVKINDAFLGTLKELTDQYELVHQTGEKNYTDVKGEADVVLEFAHKERYHPLGFLNESQIRDFYLLSDLIVSRAGASSIFEIAAHAKPSILIPLSSAAQDHQRKNAYEYAAEGGATIIEEGNLTPHILYAEIKKLMDDPVKLKRMGEAASNFARPDAAEIIAKEILKLGVH